ERLHPPKRKIPQMTDGGGDDGELSLLSAHHSMGHGSRSKKPRAENWERCSRVASLSSRGAMEGCTTSSSVRKSLVQAASASAKTFGSTIGSAALVPRAPPTLFSASCCAISLVRIF